MDILIKIKASEYPKLIARSGELELWETELDKGYVLNTASQSQGEVMDIAVFTTRGILWEWLED